MTDPERVSAAGPAPHKQDPEALALRGRPRPVTRFRRGPIIGLTGAACAALVGLAWLALEPPALPFASSEEQLSGPAKGTPEVLAAAPASYADVPVLGPPLPGDLGRPILDRKRRAGQAALDETADMATIEAEGVPALEEERARRAAEQQAARASAVLVRLELRDNMPDAMAAPQAGPKAMSAGPSSRAHAASGQQQRSGSVTGSPAAIGADPVLVPPRPWTLSAGTVIPASLLTGLNSDLPGIVVAQVTAHVRDSATGRTILIPQGARLIGRYDSSVAYGQKRALLSWERIIFPDGRSLRIDKMPATDAAGYAGLGGRLDSHQWQMLKGVVLSTILGLASEVGGGGNDIAHAIRQSAQQSGTRAGEQLVSRALDIKPTLVVPPGWPVRVLVDRDLVLEPWTS